MPVTLIEKEPPPRPGQGQPTVSALDRQILAVLSEGSACKTGEIAKALNHPATHISARLRLLTDRGLVQRVPQGPSRGPWAFTYRLADGVSETVAGYWSSPLS